MNKARPPPIHLRHEILIFLLMAAVICAVLFFRVRGHSQTGNWVDKLQNQSRAVCCFDNDGRRLEDPEWRVVGSNYEVLFTEGWVVVPDDAVVTMTNQDGIARVWSLMGAGGRTIRCFQPSALS